MYARCGPAFIPITPTSSREVQHGHGRVATVTRTGDDMMCSWQKSIGHQVDDMPATFLSVRYRRIRRM